MGPLSIMRELNVRQTLRLISAHSSTVILQVFTKCKQLLILIATKTKYWISIYPDLFYELLCPARLIMMKDYLHAQFLACEQLGKELWLAGAQIIIDIFFKSTSKSPEIRHGKNEIFIFMPSF